ncbi:hypothetical protein ACKKBG_A25675 [Auxenochlorella protothecoides x Auxenochlorella symbiontica]
MVATHNMMRAGLALLGLATSCIALDASIWPQPERQINGNRQFWLDASRLSLEIKGADSDILQHGLDRFIQHLRLAPEQPPQEHPGTQSDDSIGNATAAGGGLSATSGSGPLPDEVGHHHHRRRRHHHRALQITAVHVTVYLPDQSLGPATNDSYSLAVAAPAIKLHAVSVYGALHGLESLAQLVRRRPCDGLCGAEASSEGPEQEGEADVPNGHRHHSRKRHRRRTPLILGVQETVIHDAPRFPHRGLLIDTARHFLSMDTIKAHLDAMSASKLNVLHWHLVDDQSFGYGSEALPELPAQGAFSKSEVYSLGDVVEIVAYARQRGIRVLPEFDTPGHTLSWGKAFPGLLAACYGDDGRRLEGRWGPIDPTRPEAYGLMWRLLREAARIFPDSALHLGGDEVDPSCWESNPNITAWMRDHGIAHDSAALEQRWLLRMQGLALALGRVPVVWEEAFGRAGAGLDPKTLVHVWKWWGEGREREQGAAALASARRLMAGRMAWEGPGWAAEATTTRSMPLGPGLASPGPEDPRVWAAKLSAVTAAGHGALLSAPWYLNLGTFAEEDWKRYYAADPTAFPARNSTQRDLVLGGEACLWGEFIDDTNALQRGWPAAAAVAERLWSPGTITSLAAAGPRLAQFRCWLLRLGIPAAPLGPGSCQ